MPLRDHVEVEIHAGGAFAGAFTLTDDNDDTLTSAWTGRLEVRETYGGPLVVAFAADGTAGAEGTLTIDDFGQVLLEMPADATGDLPSTTDSAGWHDRYFVADVEVWPVANPTARAKPGTPFRVYITPEVTTG